jgi:hypothetical protein
MAAPNVGAPHAEAGGLNDIAGEIVADMQNPGILDRPEGICHALEETAARLVGRMFAGNENRRILVAA